VKAFYIGSVPSFDGKWENWAKETALNPRPIKYELVPVNKKNMGCIFRAIGVFMSNYQS
jgi:hypothetical protein